MAENTKKAAVHPLSTEEMTANLVKARELMREINRDASEKKPLKGDAYYRDEPYDYLARASMANCASVAADYFKSAAFYIDDETGKIKNQFNRPAPMEIFRHYYLAGLEKTRAALHDVIANTIQSTKVYDEKAPEYPAYYNGYETMLAAYEGREPNLCENCYELVNLVAGADPAHELDQSVFNTPERTSAEPSEPAPKPDPPPRPTPQSYKPSAKRRESKPYYTSAELDMAKNADVIPCLKAMGYDIKPDGTGRFKILPHNSLALSLEKGWYWNSQNLHGKSNIDLVKALLMVDQGMDEKEAAIHAVKTLAGTEGQNLPRDTVYHAPVKASPQPTVQKPEELVLPERNTTMRHVYAYLTQTRGLDGELVAKLMREKKLYETKEHHNACFVIRDDQGKPRHASMRGTIPGKVFKQDVAGSDKSYGTLLPGRPGSTTVCCFEGHIDAISHASLYKMNGMDYQDVHRVTLDGTSFLALDGFLKEHPEVKNIVSCLDSDEAGKKRSKAMVDTYTAKGYNVKIQEPEAKDYNDQLLNTKAARESARQNQNQGQKEAPELEDDE
jgi:hypothetical protein